METYKVITKSAAETVNLGARLARTITPGMAICLFGDLGSGKTTLVKGIARGLKVKQEKVNSPSFVLMNIYDGKLPVYHFDLYRLEDIKNIAEIGYEEFIYGKGVAVIEWAERAKKLLPQDYLKVELKHKSPNERVIKFSAQGIKNKLLLKELLKK